MKDENLWNIEDIIKQRALNGCDRIGLSETSKHLNISQDAVLDIFIKLSQGNYPKLNIKFLITCPNCQDVLYSFEFEKVFGALKNQYYCQHCEDMVDINASGVYLLFKINPNYLESAKEYKRKKRLEKAKELAKYITMKTEDAGLTYHEIKEDVYNAWLEIKEERKQRR
jgi:AraC-like DNA-binding protein